MAYIRTFFVSLGMYTRFPLKLKSKGEVSSRQLLIYLIAAGGIVGLLWKFLCDGMFFLGLPAVILSAVLGLFPYWVTGYLHLESFMETSAVILSGRQGYGKAERHGAFGVIALVVLFLLNFAGMYCFVEERRSSYLLLFIPLISRELTVLTLFLFPALSGEKYPGSDDPRKGQTTALLMLLFVLSALACVTLTGISGSLLITAMIAGFLISAFSAKAHAGLTGDTAGYALTLSETVGLLALAIFRF